jgi:hypothetical protein
MAWNTVEHAVRIDLLTQRIAFGKGQSGFKIRI